MKAFYPAYPNVAPETNEPILVEINARMVPVLLSALERYKFPPFWTDEEAYHNGVQQINLIQEAILTGATNIVEAIDRLYRLVDTSFNGTLYTQVDGVVNPPISAAPPLVADSEYAMRAHLTRLWLLMENAHAGRHVPDDSGIAGLPGLPASYSWANRLLALQGETGGFFGLGATPTTLADLLQAGRINTANDEGAIDDTFEEILNTLAGGGSVATALTNLLGRGVDLASDGGMMLMQAAQVAASMVSAQAAQVTNLRLVQELSRLNTFLTGGDAGALAPPLPATGVLYPGLFDPAGELYVPQILSQLQGDIGTLANYLTGASDNTLGIVERGEEISGKLTDPNQNLSVAQWLVANTAAAQGIVNYLRQEGIDPTTQQTILKDIRTALQSGGGPGGAGTVTLDATQFAALTAVLDCICEGVTGTPTVGSAPQFDSSHCGPSWEAVAVWRPTVTGETLSAEDGAWTMIDNQSGAFTIATAADGVSVIAQTNNNGGPMDCRVYAATATGADIGGVAWSITTHSFSATAPVDAAQPIDSTEVCATATIKARDTAGTIIGYGANPAVVTGADPLTPNNFAIFLMFGSFG